MIKMKEVAATDLDIRAVSLWLNQWLLLTCGDYKKSEYNTMTVAWGSIGAMWDKPFAQVVVRPVRYTFEFIEKYMDFTLCAFPEKYRRDLKLLGTRSGRDGDKISQTSLHIIESKIAAAPSFAEAELVLECRKIYWDDFKAQNFLHPDIASKYPQKDYHRIYYGEILCAQINDTL